MAREIIHTAAGRQVTIQARLVPKFLWFTASIEALVDGKCVAASGGSFRLSGTATGSFEDASGRSHELVLEWSSFSGGFLERDTRLLPALSYSLIVDGKTVSGGAVIVRNRWMIAAGPALVMAVVMFYLGRGLTTSFSDMEKKLNQSIEQGGER